jgi:hypothetical protein
MSIGTIILEPDWLCSASQDPTNMPPLLDFYNLESLLIKMGYSHASFNSHFADLAIALREWHESFYGCIPMVQDWEFWIDEMPDDAEWAYDQDAGYSKHPDACTSLSPMWVMVFPASREVARFVALWMLWRGVSIPGEYCYE